MGRETDIFMSRIVDVIFITNGFISAIIIFVVAIIIINIVASIITFDIIVVIIIITRIEVIIISMVFVLSTIKDIIISKLLVITSSPLIITAITNIHYQGIDLIICIHPQVLFSSVSIKLLRLLLRSRM